MLVLHRTIIDTLGELDKSEYLLIQGLPGIGLVGYLLAEFLVEEFESELKFSLIPYDTPPVSMLEKESYKASLVADLKVYEVKGLKRPVLVLTGKRQPEIAIYDTFLALLEFTKGKISDIVAVGGMTGSTNEIGGFGYSDETVERLKSKGVPPIKVEEVMNVSGAVAVLPKLATLFGIRARGLLSKVHEPEIEVLNMVRMIDPKASKRAMVLLNNVYDLGIPEEKLVFFDKKEEVVRREYDKLFRAIIMRESMSGSKHAESIHEGEEDKYYV